MRKSGFRLRGGQLRQTRLFSCWNVVEEWLVAFFRSFSVSLRIVSCDVVGVVFCSCPLHVMVLFSTGPVRSVVLLMALRMRGI